VLVVQQTWWTLFRRTQAVLALQSVPDRPRAIAANAAVWQLDPAMGVLVAATIVLLIANVSPSRLSRALVPRYDHLQPLLRMWGTPTCVPRALKCSLRWPNIFKTFTHYVLVLTLVKVPHFTTPRYFRALRSEFIGYAWLCEKYADLLAWWDERLKVLDAKEIAEALVDDADPPESRDDDEQDLDSWCTETQEIRDDGEAEAWPIEEGANRFINLSDCQIADPRGVMQTPFEVMMGFAADECVPQLFGLAMMQSVFLHTAIYSSLRKKPAKATSAVQTKEDLDVVQCGKTATMEPIVTSTLFCLEMVEEDEYDTVMKMLRFQSNPTVQTLPVGVWIDTTVQSDGLVMPFNTQNLTAAVSSDDERLLRMVRTDFAQNQHEHTEQCVHRQVYGELQPKRSLSDYSLDSVNIKRTRA
jgi:hypothetical protein